MGLLLLLFVGVHALDPVAHAVYGQADSFTTSSVLPTGPGSLSIPSRISLDSSGYFYVCDAGSNRVLVFSPGSALATGVYGQGGIFTSGSSGTTQSTFSGPRGISVAPNGDVFVSDSGNSRILHYTSGNMTLAFDVYGQTNFTASPPTTGATATTFTFPNALFTDGIDLYSVDSSNNRVLRFPIGVKTAAFVWGQGGSYTTNSINMGLPNPTAQTLWNPSDVLLHGGGMYIADRGNARVLFYATTSTDVASRVYGQAGFTTNAMAVTADGLSTPSSLAMDSGNNLYVADESARRILVYPPGSVVATLVIGQTDLVSSTVLPVSATSLSGAISGMAIHMGKLYVMDASNARALQYDVYTSLNASANGVVLDNVDIPTATTSVVSTSLIVQGDVFASGTLSVQTGALVNVTGTLIMEGALVLSSEAAIVVGTLSLLGNASASIIIEVVPNGTSITITLVEYLSNPNNATFPSITATFATRRRRSVVTCSPGPITQQSSATSLTATVAINQCGGTPAVSSSTVGIAAGAAVGAGIVAALVIGGLTYWLKIRRTRKLTNHVRQEELASMGHTLRMASNPAFEKNTA